METCPVCGVGKENFVPVDLDEVTFHLDTLEKFVVLGGGTAALNAAKAIRERNNTASIIMVSDEEELPYDRPMLTKNMFGAVSGGAIASKEASWYEQHSIDLRLGVTVTALDLGRKEVRLSDGTVLPYDKCVYALGSHSFMPPIKGIEQEGVSAVRTIADVEKINRWTLDAKHAVVIGGGALGLEAAWELRKEKMEVTVLEGMPRLLLGKLDDTAADMLTKIAEKNGVNIQTAEEPTICISCTRPPVESFVMTISSAEPIPSPFDCKSVSNSDNVSVLVQRLSPYSASSGTARKYGTVLYQTFSLFSVYPPLEAENTASMGIPL